MKESYKTIYHLLGTGKLPRKNDSYKTVRFKLQLIFMRLPLKQPSGAGVWSRYGKKFKLTAKIRLAKCFLMTSSAWLIIVYIHSHTRN